MPILLSRSHVAALLSPADALAAAREAFLALARDQVVMPQRVATRVEVNTGTHLSMPCYVRTAEREVLCIKIATVFERNPERRLPTTMAFLALQDPQTGALLALMDAEHLTALRTAAASALAVQVLGRPGDAGGAMTLFGVGGQAGAHLPALLHVRPAGRVYVIARDIARARDFCARQQVTAELVATEDRRAAVEASDVVCTATNATAPLFDGAWLRPGAVVTAVGAFRPDMRELDAEAVRRSQVVVDRVEAARSGAGDLIQAHAEGAFGWEEAVELGSLLLDPSRVASDDRPRLFKSVGLAAQDAFIAGLAYEKAMEARVGEAIELE